MGVLEQHGIDDHGIMRFACFWGAWLGYTLMFYVFYSFFYFPFFLYELPGCYRVYLLESCLGMCCMKAMYFLSFSTTVYWETRLALFGVS